MSNNTSIAVVNNNSALLKTENTFVQALVNSRPMSALTTNEKKNYLLGCINSAIFIGGWHQKDDQDLILMANTLLVDINKEFKRFTEAEVKAAFEDGAKGYLGENKGGMSIAACIGWLTAYKFNMLRQDAIKKLQKLEPKVVPLPVSRGAKRITIQAAYDKFLGDPANNITGAMPYDYGNLVYNLMDRERMIPYTVAEKVAYVERGRMIVHTKLKLAKTLQEKKENEKKIDALMDSDTTAIFEGKRLALAEWFDTLQAMGTKEIPFPDKCLKFEHVTAQEIAEFYQRLIVKYPTIKWEIINKAA